MSEQKHSNRTDISLVGNMLEHKEKYKKKTSSVKWSNMNSHCSKKKKNSHCIFNLKHYLLLRIFVN